MTGKSDFDPFASASISDVIPMTPSQRELWMAAQQSPQASCAYNLSISVMLDGKLQEGKLRSALQQLVDRHDGLRASFAGDNFLMCIAETIEVELLVTDLRQHMDSDIDSKVRALLRWDVETPFDLVFGPMWRFQLIYVTDDKARLVLTFHHLIADGWTIDLLVKELASLYSANVSGATAELPAAYQFRDYSIWLENEYSSDVGKEADQFWLKKFADKAPVLELPVDRARNRMRSFNAARLELVFDEVESSAIFTAATRLKSTFFIFAFTNYCAFLNRITGQDEFVVAVPTAGQLDVDENTLAGHCVNTLPMRCMVESDASFSELLEKTKKNIYTANAHTPFTFGNLMGRIPTDRDTSRPPLASTLFTVDQESHNLEFANMDSHYQLNPRAFEMFEMQIAVVAQKDEIKVQCQYNTDLFDQQSIERRLSEFVTLMKETARDPQQKIAAVKILSAFDSQQIASWNDTKVRYRTGCTLQQLFTEQVAKSPDAIALEFMGDKLTYADFDLRCNQLANYLVKEGLQPGQAVGICTHRSFEMLISIYAVVKAGGAYVPLDPDYPRDRLEFIREDCGASIILAHEQYRPLVSNTSATVFYVDSQWHNIDAMSKAFAGPTLDESSLAYIIYTSGSTGRPKGVMNEHRGICNQLFWMQDKFAVDSSDHVLLKTPYSFDVSVWELFFPLLNGARLVIAPPDAHRDPEQLNAIIRESKITGTCFVPSLLAAYLSHSDTHESHNLRWIISIGEAMTPDLQSRFAKQLPGVELHNLYGPTEAAVGATHWLCGPQKSSRTVPIGKPFANVQIYILDTQCQQVPVGVSGELYIGGIQVARGYHNRPDLNKEVFVDDPYSDVDGARMYKTGDLARWTNDGVIEYLGRVDFQVKFAGLRIELGEIESILEELPEIQNSVVIVHGTNTDVQQLVAYYSSSRTTSKSELREHLSRKLPQYMIPHLFVELESLPLNTAGKLDRNALPEPEFRKTANAEDTAGEAALVGETEKLLGEVWRDVIGGALPGRFDNFFEIGGHSLLAIRVVSTLRLRVGVAVPLHMFLLEELREIADYLDNNATTPSQSLASKLKELLAAVLPARAL